MESIGTHINATISKEFVEDVAAFGREFTCSFETLDSGQNPVDEGELSGIELLIFRMLRRSDWCIGVIFFETGWLVLRWIVSKASLDMIEFGVLTRPR